MNVLFLTIGKFESINDENIYCDLLREFIKNGHNVFVVSPTERRYKLSTCLVSEPNCQLLKVKTGNIQKINVLEKGISTVLIETQFKLAIKKYFSKVKFDLIMYSTPPITFGKVIEYIKKRDNAKSYLLLKDIFPQNAVDLGMMSKNSLIYKFFRKKEKSLYHVSDSIGCLSPANVKYLLKNNTEIDKKIVHVSPNTIKINEEIENIDYLSVRDKYKIPKDKKVFIYGGNLGKPQDIPFIIECLKKNVNKNDRFFIISGTGTEYSKIKYYIEKEKPNNVLLINGLPRVEYEKLVRSCDVGLIFLDHRFTIPNFPCRLLSYIKNSMPVIACTDLNTDVGEFIVKNEFGWWCESNSSDKFTELVNSACKSNLTKMGKKALKYLENNFTVDRSYRIILEALYENSCK